MDLSISQTVNVHQAGYAKNRSSLERWRSGIHTVMAMAISYNWLFLWDEIHSINGVSSVLITGMWGLNCIDGL